MHVLHVFKTYWPETFGGIERSIDAIIKHGRRFGVEGEVITLAETGDNPVLKKDDYAIHRARRSLDIASTGISFDAFGQFRSLAKRADIVHYHFPWPFMDAMHFASFHRRPSIVTYHSDIVKQKSLLWVYRPLMKAFLAQMDAIIATSPAYRETSQILNLFMDKVEVIPLGLSRADYASASVDRIERWHKRFSKPFALFSGVFRYYKGLDFLLTAASQVPFDIVLIGDGAERSRLEEIARRDKLDNVHFLGAVDEPDKVALLELCSVFVLPSHQRSEAYGLSLVEAAMAGKPLVSCAIGSGTSFVNRDGVTGFCVPPADPVSLAYALRRIVTDQKLAQSMGAAARLHFDNELTAEKMAKRYADVYKRVIGNSK